MMNAPEEKPVTIDDVIREYKIVKDAKKVAAIYDLPVYEVKQIIKAAGL